MKTITAESAVVQQLLTDGPAFHLGGSAHWDAFPETLDCIRRSVRPGARTLETGTGLSTVIFAAAGAQHTAISPDPKEHELIAAYCREAGIDTSGLTFIVGFSDEVLPDLLGTERTLDVAFIDGGHTFPLPIVDWHYVSRALKIGGTLIMDDIAIPASVPAVRNMEVDPSWRVDAILDDRAGAYTLVAAPDLQGDWTRQPFNRRPDFSFASPVRRLRLRSEWYGRQLRVRTADRYPGLRALYRRVR